MASYVFFSYFPFREGVLRTGGLAEAIDELGLDDGEEGFDWTLPSEPEVEDGLDLEAKGEGGGDQTMLPLAGPVAWGVALGGRTGPPALSRSPT